MFLRFTATLLTLSILLFAAPNTQELQEAIKQNPALLQTPQAQQELKKRGLSDSEVLQKLKQSQTLNPNNDISIADKFVENNVSDDLESEDISQDTNETNQTLIDSQRLNPFTFNTSDKLREEIRQKQSLLTKKKLTRYSQKFYTNQNIIDSSALPTPQNYIISSGDELNIFIYGDRDTLYTPTVTSNGTIEIPYIGPVKVGGLTFGEAKEYLQGVLQNHFKMSDFSISINKYSTIQVTLVGDVKHPGLYNLSSFSTIKDLLVVSKGLGDTTSVRDILIKRDGVTVAHVDFYDLLFDGKELTSHLLKHGDIVVAKQAKTLVSIDGFVNNSAIFELKEHETLRDLLRYAGGMKADASRVNIKVKRYSNNSKIETFKLSYDKAGSFKLKNGDSIVVYPLDDSARANVNIYGNIIRPGSYPIGSKATLGALLRDATMSGAKSFFLPETYFEYGVIKRYSNSLNYETISFDLKDVLDGKKEITIKPQDEIYIFSQNDIFSSKYVTTKGDILLKPGKLQYFNKMTLADAINAAGMHSVADDKVKVTTFNTPNLMPKTSFYSLKNEGNVTLSPYDEIEVLDYYDTHVIEPVSISGEVLRPSVLYYEEGMSVADLVNMAGGLTPKAYKRNLEIVRYFVDANETRQRKILKIDTSTTAMSEIKLQPYDEVMIFKIPKWNENQVVELKGEVRFPGKYTVEPGERLSSVLLRAGGFTQEAFIDGAVFTRESIRQKQIEEYNKSLAKIKRELAIYNAMPANAKRNMAAANPTDVLNEVILEAEKYQPVGRISIKLEEDMQKLQKSEYDLVLQDKDVITIPSQIDTVSIFGEVFNPSSFVYRKNYDSEDYIELASGYTRGADASRAYVIHADGTSEPASSGWSILSSSAEISRGDTIVVPLHIQEFNQLEIWDSVSRIMSSFAITAATLNTLGVIK